MIGRRSPQARLDALERPGLIRDWRWRRLKRKVDRLAGSRPATLGPPRREHEAPSPLIAGSARLYYAESRIACPDTVAELLADPEWFEL